MEDEIYLSDITAFLRRYRALIFGITLAVVIISVGAAFIMKKTYETSLTVYLARESGGLSEIMQLGGLLGMAVQSNSTPYLTTLAKSRSVKIDIIETLDLRHNNAFMGDTAPDAPEEELIGKLTRMIVVMAPRGHGLEITVQGPAPELVYNVGNGIISGMKKIINKNQREEVEFLAGQLESTGEELNLAEEELRVFLESHRDTDITSRTTGLIDSYTDLKKRMTMLDLEEARLRRAEGLAGDLKTVQLFRSELAEVDAKRDALAAETARLDSRLAALPGHEIQAARLHRKVDELEIIYKVLVEQHEIMKREMLKESALFQVVDPPYMPHIHSFPSKKTIALASAVFGLLFGIFAAYLLNYHRGRTADSL